ncbi:MAG: hypothetical protein IPQ01_18210 [Zoogloea sp.]|nr:hypothetical protein [Zoogloea sp.]
MKKIIDSLRSRGRRPSQQHRLQPTLRVVEAPSSWLEVIASSIGSAGSAPCFMDWCANRGTDLPAAVSIYVMEVNQCRFWHRQLEGFPLFV